MIPPPGTFEIYCTWTQRWPEWWIPSQATASEFNQ